MKWFESLQSSLLLVPIVLHLGVSFNFQSSNLQSFRASTPKFTRANLKMAEFVGDKLFDMPISNAGARCRLVIYEKGIEESVKIVSPMDLGGLKSPEYLQLNPQGKMPCLVTKDGTSIPESACVVEYLLETYTQGPSFRPEDAAARIKDRQIVRHHDMYLQSIQGCMYKATPDFWGGCSRAEALQKLKTQLAVLEDMVSAEGPFLSGPQMGVSDITVFPTAVFWTEILPAQFGWEMAEVFGPKMQKWWDHMLGLPVGQKVQAEIKGPLDGWAAGGRFDSILGAGWKDTDPATIFDKIIAKEIPSTVVHEDDKCLAFRDINPQGPTHILVIPKQRQALTRLSNATEEHTSILGHLMVVAAKVAKADNLEGYRVVVNDGEVGGQEVFHLHVHVIGGRKMNWPPG
eukprot:CAMPEP_0113934438 /NCGR_PEP_ID=MMETSP1339-20121228/1760_1 /TAXON_ID=94617 /ORGANISM="Fibrocapsa japonica" /LENGTH=401 /DNA_ID=CAMNT_0000936241 /DNA_START=12 /DNA_END=1217 /DNA_ORIENTATION=- /assembly_acc=CAM_ASM_000762